MKVPRPNLLARTLREFLAEHLPRLRATSPHTVHSYRDSLVLLLRFVATHRARPVVELDIDDLGAEEVIAFLQHLEDERHNSPATRNVRLAAIHAFFAYLAGRCPDRLEHCQRILAVPFKRTRSRVVEYLEYEEIQAVLAAVDRGTAEGRRDYALLALMFNTGARVQEIVDLKPANLQLHKPFHVRLIGKGRKERLCPLWPQTAQLLSDLIGERGLAPDSRESLFVNRCGRTLTRFGIRFLLGKYCTLAQNCVPTLARKRLHPHSMRHSTAIHLLKSGVDLVTISHWLGHASVNTTNRYTAIDLEAKREAIAKIEPVNAITPSVGAWRSDASILAWLEAL